MSNTEVPSDWNRNPNTYARDMSLAQMCGGVTGQARAHRGGTT